MTKRDANPKPFYLFEGMEPAARTAKPQVGDFATHQPIAPASTSELLQAEGSKNYEQGSNDDGAEEIISLRRGGEARLDMDESLNDGNSAFSDALSNGPHPLAVEE